MAALCRGSLQRDIPKTVSLLNKRLYSETSKALNSRPFFVRRTKTNNIPVYLDYKNGKTRTLTIVRKIEGDVQALEKELRKVVKEKKVFTRVDNLTRQIVFLGDYRNTIMKHIKSLGF